VAPQAAIAATQPARSRIAFLYVQLIVRLSKNSLTARIITTSGTHSRCAQAMHEYRICTASA